MGKLEIKPKVTSSIEKTKTVEVYLTSSDITEIVKDYLQRHVPQTRGMDMTYEFDADTAFPSESRYTEVTVKGLQCKGVRVEKAGGPD